MAVIQLDKGHNFRRDSRLSWKARGILAYLLDHEETWEVTVQDLIQQSDVDGRIAVQSAMQELLTHHYAKLVPVRDNYGKVRGKKYIVYSSPYDLAGDSGHRQAGNMLIGPDKQENRQTENMPVGKDQKFHAVPSDDRRAGFPTIGKTDGRETCLITKELKKKKKQIKREIAVERGDARGESIPPKRRPSKSVPVDWALTDALRDWAATEVPGVNLDYETSKFRDHHFRDAHTDWDATWRNWMRYAWERLPPGIQRRTDSTTPRTPRLVL